MASLAAELREIYNRRGELVAEQVHDEVAAEDHPLHDRYEWDDTIAGRRYRIIQITADIRSCELEFISPKDGQRKRTREFVSVRNLPARRGYAPIEEVAQDPMTLRILERECELAIADLVAKYGHLKEFAQMMKNAVA